MRAIIMISVWLAISSSLAAQDIPANTGYAVPAENDESHLFTSNGVEHWKDPTQKLEYFFNLRSTGALNIALNLKSLRAGNIIRLTVAGKDFIIPVPQSGNFRLIKAGRINITTKGFYKLTITPVRKVDQTIADIRSISLSGPASTGIHFNSNERRNAASVHLRYPLPDSTQALQFYNEITIPMGADPVGTYYMACGFRRGYFGIQVNSLTQRRVIFSVWDAGSESTDRSKVSEANKTQLIAKGEEVFSDGFGNEGTGGHSHWIYPWKPGTTYKFLVSALPDSASRTTIYTGYFFIPEKQEWKLIASFRAPADGKYLDHLYSFSENFEGSNGQVLRKAYFGNQWILNSHGKWVELVKANFTYDATGQKGDRLDYGAGIENNKFYLWHGGFTAANVKYKDSFTRTGTAQNPVIDLYKNADSIIQARKDRALIFEALASGKYDTSGSIGGVYYKILKAGTGSKVEISDTVTANYKGYLLNGEVFDQSKNTPAVFPLNRLIKGWQIGVPVSRVGGIIRLIIPSALAYSIRARSSKIPPNSVLVFDIEIVGIKSHHPDD